MNEQRKNAIILYVVGQNSTITSIGGYMKSQWSLVHEPHMFEHEEGYLIIKLGSKEDRDPIVYVGPHLFFGSLMIVKQWSASFYFHKGGVESVPYMG